MSIPKALQSLHETEVAITSLKAFFVIHSEALTCFTWRAFPFHGGEIRIAKQYGDNVLTPSQIAALFGQTGWKRQPSSYATGAMDWVKELDGCTLKIENAESAVVSEEVRFG